VELHLFSQWEVARFFAMPCRATLFQPLPAWRRRRIRCPSFYINMHQCIHAHTKHSDDLKLHADYLYFCALAFLRKISKSFRILNFDPFQQSSVVQLHLCGEGCTIQYTTRYTQLQVHTHWKINKFRTNFTKISPFVHFFWSEKNDCHIEQDFIVKKTPENYIL